MEGKIKVSKRDNLQNNKKALSRIREKLMETNKIVAKFAKFAKFTKFTRSKMEKKTAL